MIKKTRHCTENEFNFYTKIEPELKIVIDAGASDSFFEYLDCEVHFFEPDSEHFNNLTKNSNKNHYYNKLGLGNTAVKKLLYNELGSIINWDYTKLNIKPKDLTKTEEIKIIRLEDYLINNNIQEISLYKVDIEGMDYEAIEGLGKFINKCKYITFEFQGHISEWNEGGAENSLQKYKELLLNYSLFNIDNEGSLTNITANMLQGYYNFVAINKFL